MTPENINIIKRRFLHYKKPQDIIAKMYGSLFDGIYQSNREKYLAFLKEVEKDNRFGELEEILSDKFMEDYKLAYEALKEYYGKKEASQTPTEKAGEIVDSMFGNSLFIGVTREDVGNALMKMHKHDREALTTWFCDTLKDMAIEPDDVAPCSNNPSHLYKLNDRFMVKLKDKLTI